MPADLDVDAWLRRMRLLGIVVPLASIVALHLLMELVLDRLWPQHTTVIGWVVGALGLLAFGWLMFLAIDRGRRILQAQNAARLEQAQRVAVLEERERIAREMHDSLAQVLGVAHLQLRSLASRADVGPAVATELSDLAEICHESYQDVREAILGLRESPRGDRTMLQSLARYLQAYSRHSGIEAQLIVDGDRELDLAPQVEVQLIRVVQEALTNVRKHSGARRVEVEVSDAGPGLRLAVCDDGTGFAAGTATASMAGGYGLQTMRERTEQVGGRLEVQSAPGQGTRVVVHLPLTDPDGPDREAAA